MKSPHIIYFILLLISIAHLEVIAIKNSNTNNILAGSTEWNIEQKIAQIEGLKTENISKDKTEKILRIHFDNGILFKTAKTTIKPETKNKLDKLVEIIGQDPLVKIVVTGHTDNIGSLETNQQLSEMRALAVANYLLERKLNSTQIAKVIGKNFAEPVADNSTEKGRAANRHAEIFILLPCDKDNKCDSVTTKQIPALYKSIFEDILQTAKKQNEVGIELDGLLIDDTKTRNGKEFYDLFYASWIAPKDAKNYSITISEKPFRVMSTLVAITINENTVYQAILQPRQDLIEAQTEEANYAVFEYLNNYEEITKELNGDDMTGDGIY